MLHSSRIFLRWERKGEAACFHHSFSSALCTVLCTCDDDSTCHIQTKLTSPKIDDGMEVMVMMNSCLTCLWWAPKKNKLNVFIIQRVELNRVKNKMLYNYYIGSCLHFAYKCATFCKRFWLIKEIIIMEQKCTHIWHNNYFLSSVRIPRMVQYSVQTGIMIMFILKRVINMDKL